MPWLGNARMLLIMEVEDLEGLTTGSSVVLLGYMLKPLARLDRSVANSLEKSLDVHGPGIETRDIIVLCYAFLAFTGGRSSIVGFKIFAHVRSRAHCIVPGFLSIVPV